MTADIVSYWSRLGTDERVHPDDRTVFERLGRDGHAFDLNCLPSCYYGPISTAPIVLLYLSPGLDETEDHAHAASTHGREYYRGIRAGRQLLPTPTEHHSAWRWWSSRVKCFGDWSEIHAHVAILDISGYHSKNFKDWALLSALPSCRATVAWAQASLFPDAISGKRIVICLRSPKHWGLKVGLYGKALFVPSTTRAGHMKHGEMRDEVVSAVREKLGLQQ
jgi:hypothetical protein